MLQMNIQQKNFTGVFSLDPSRTKHNVRYREKIFKSKLKCYEPSTKYSNNASISATGEEQEIRDPENSK